MSRWYLIVEKDGTRAVALGSNHRKVLEDLKTVIQAKGEGYTFEIIPSIDYSHLRKG